ncbi:MAG: hypothetical protein II900_03090 [Prevotella sp.]|nr:hypothetical protein [Prevotella sp.]
MTYKETEILIQKYLNGETTAEEERLLALEVSRKDAPDDWKVITEMLGELTVDEALFDQIMAERKQKPRIIRFWPWVAAACVAALLVVFLGPPREKTYTQPQVAKVEPKKIEPEVKAVEPVPVTVEKEIATEPTPAKRIVAKAVTKPRKENIMPEQDVQEPQKQTEEIIEPIAEPTGTTNDIAQVEEPVMQDFRHDAKIDFNEFTRSIRERGKQVTHRVAMNSLPQDKYQLNL